MNIFSVTQIILTTLILVFLLAFRYKPQISRFELERLAVDSKARKKQLRFLEIYPGLRTFLYILALIDLIALCSAFLFALGFLGAVLAFALIILAFLTSRALHKIMRDLIERHFAWFNKYFGWTEVFGKIVIAGEEPKIHSRHELAHLVETGDFMEMADKILLLGALEFTDKKVEDVMVAKNNIVSVKPTDAIGPKLLDDLHQSGHLVFPVKKGQDIIGMLHVEDVVTLDQGEKAVTEMMRRVPTAIFHSATLTDALTEMKSDHSCQLLVVDDEEKLVGLIDICDIMNILFGRKL